jgi:hypothetical protein
MTERIKKLVTEIFPTHSGRLIDDALPRGLPEDLHPDLRGRWLLEHYGPSGIHEAIEETLACEARVGGLGIGPDFLGFIEDYFRIAQYVATLDLRTVIVDVGCCAGLQQVFFSQFEAYIGIDQHLADSVRPLQPNARFVEGNFGKLVNGGTFVIEPGMFGIANRSLLYQEGNAPSIGAFKQFARLVMS